MMRTRAGHRVIDSLSLVAVRFRQPALCLCFFSVASGAPSAALAQTPGAVESPGSETEAQGPDRPAQGSSSEDETSEAGRDLQPAESSGSSEGEPRAEVAPPSSGPSAQEYEEALAELRARVAALEEAGANAAAPHSAEPQESKGESPTPEGRVAATTAEVGLTDAKSEVRGRRTVRDDHLATPRPNNASDAAALKGFFALGKTGTWMKLGGYIKLDANFDSTQIGNPNKFATSSIPTETDPSHGGGAQFHLHAKQSRLRLETRTPTKIGSLRIVYENDFYGDGTGPGMAYNLRHLYGQIANLAVGHTWTLYIDSDAIPDTLDFAGPGIQAITRQAQVRYSLPFADNHAHFALGVEQPTKDVSGLGADMEASNVLPDFTAALRLEDERIGHLHVAGVARDLGYEDAAGSTHRTFAWSSNASGVLNVFAHDSLSANITVGRGTGHYAQDLGTGNAAAIDADGSLQALLTLGGFVGYRRVWTDALHSQFTYGYLQLENHPAFGAGDYRSTHYGQGNLILTIADRFHVGGEYLYGYKTTQDGASGDDHRGQVSVKMSLF